jgi:hypothetical protein
MGRLTQNTRTRKDLITNQPSICTEFNPHKGITKPFMTIQIRDARKIIFAQTDPDLNTWKSMLR